MARFMPVNEEASARLNEKLSKTFYRSVPDFVSVYNQGIINKKYDEVQLIASEIVKTYRDVKERSGKFVFSSEQEVYLEEINKVLSDWTTITRIKREIESLIEDGVIHEGERIVFTTEPLGYICRLTEDGEVERLNSDRVHGRQEFVADLYDSFSTAKNEELADEKIYQFNTRDFTNLDDSFIERIYHEIPTP